MPAGAWPDPDPAVPARPLWGSPLLPARIWYAAGMPGLAGLSRLAAVDGTELRNAAGYASRPDGHARPDRLPELTVTPPAGSGTRRLANLRCSRPTRVRHQPRSSPLPGS